MGKPLWNKDVGLIEQYVCTLGLPQDGVYATSQAAWFGRQCTFDLPGPGSKWPPESLRNHRCRDEILTGLLTLSPDMRISASAGCDHFDKYDALKINYAAHASRGDIILRAGNLEPVLLEWLQADPHLPGLAQHIEGYGKRRKVCTAASESMLNLKYEETGYVTTQAPSSTRCNSMDMSNELEAKRIVAFMRAFREINRNWLLQLTDKVHKAVQRLPEEVLGSNGRDFLTSCFTDTALCYATIQVMKGGQRYDPGHFDGGASLLHAGLTLFGQRAVAYLDVDGMWTQQLQKPGDLYVGNLTAAFHQVEHFHPEEAEPLLYNEEAEGVGLS